jgi:hypothetical protein
MLTARANGDGFQLQQLQHGGCHEQYDNINLLRDDVFHGNDCIHRPLLHPSFQNQNAGPAPELGIAAVTGSLRSL